MLPLLKNVPAQSYLNIKKFGGINLTSSYTMGELTSCNNVSLADSPALTTRKRRKLLNSCDGVINGVGYYDEYFYTYYKEESSEIFLWFKGNIYNYTAYTNSQDLKSKRKYAKTEKSIIIIPDNVVFYTDSLKFKPADISMHASYEKAYEKFLSESGDDDALDGMRDTHIGSIYHNKISSRVIKYIPESTKVYDFYCFSYAENIEIGDVLTIKLKASSPSAEASDEYTKLLNNLENGIVLKVKNIEKVTHDIVGNKTIEEVTSLFFDDNAIDIGVYDDLVFDEISIEKKLPSFCNICSFNNRVWGVAGKEIYASSLGDGDEFNDFSVDAYGTLPSSSFSALSGTDGDFTAIIPHGNYIYAFKENYIHKIYGDSPDEYSISNFEAPGAIKGADTVCVCGMYIMYASCDGVCIMRDGYPKLISKKLGRISPVCACAQGNNFYMIGKKDEGRVLYVYSLDNDCWTMESCSSDADNLCSDSNTVCFTQGNEVVFIKTNADMPYSEKQISWSFNMHFDNSDFCRKTAIRAMARISLGENSGFTAKLIYDDGTKSAICGLCYDETENGSALMRLPVKRDLGFYMEFKGFGDFTLRSLKFNFYKGNEE